MPSLLAAVEATGVAVLAMRGSHHFSALWPDLEPLADRGLVSLTTVAGQACVVPPGGRVPVFGTNPFGFATPVAGSSPLVFDFATSTMSNGDTRIAAREGRKVPQGTGIDRDGQPTTDPNAILDGGALLPFGGHKGLAMTLMVELLAAALTGGSFSSEVDYSTHPGAETPRTGQLLIAIDPSRGATRVYADRARDLIDAVRRSGASRLPSDRRYAARAQALEAGIPSRARNSTSWRPSPTDPAPRSLPPPAASPLDRTHQMTHRTALSILAGEAKGPILRLDEPLSFWGGVDPATAMVIDTRHPQHGACLSGAVVMMSTTRGSCSGSGVVLEMALSGVAPAALVFAEVEDVATLGALVAAEMFAKPIPVLRLDRAPSRRWPRRAMQRSMQARSGRHVGHSGSGSPGVGSHPRRARSRDARRVGGRGRCAGHAHPRRHGAPAGCGPSDRRHAGPYRRMHLCRPRQSGVCRGDGGDGRTGARADHDERDLGGPRRLAAAGRAGDFGEPAARLADAYVRMGCRPTFTCAPYLLDGAPQEGEPIGWSESNAVIFANSVLGARTAKHPDFLDLCIAITGRAPLAGPFLDEERRARVVIDVDLPAGAGASAWPLIGYLAGGLAPDRIPLLRGLAAAAPTQDDLKALCAAFGTTSAAPMLHVEGVTPEAQGAAAPDAATASIDRAALVAGWRKLNDGPAAVDLVAIGSPHASLAECRALAEALGGRRRQNGVAAIVTAGRQVLAEAERDGTRQALAASGVEMIPDLCWCSISRPVFPVEAKTVITTSGKYAHYGPGLSGCAVRLGTLDDCVEALLTGRAPARLPGLVGLKLRRNLPRRASVAGSRRVEAASAIWSKGFAKAVDRSIWTGFLHAFGRWGSQDGLPDPSFAERAMAEDLQNETTPKRAGWPVPLTSMAVCRRWRARSSSWSEGSHGP